MDLTNVAERLEIRFGLGSNPALRKALYLRLERIVDEQGERACRVIAEAAVDAQGKREPGRYFCRAVMARLYERGIIVIKDF